MTQQSPDLNERHAVRHRNAGIGVAKVVDPDIIQAGLFADVAPGLLQVDQMLTLLRARQDKS